MAKKIFLNPVSDPQGNTDDILKEIREIYFKTNRSTILRDFDRAIDLLKAMPTPEERQRATVYMEGLAEMRKEFGVGNPRRQRRGSDTPRAARTDAGPSAHTKSTKTRRHET